MPQWSTMPLLSTTPLPPHTPPPQLTSPPLPLMLSPRARTSPTPTSTELLMTTPRLTSTLLSLLMDLVLSQDLTPLLFLTAVPSTSSIPQTTTTDMSPRSPTRESLSIPKPSLTCPHLPQPTM